MLFIGIFTSIWAPDRSDQYFKSKKDDLMKRVHSKVAGSDIIAKDDFYI
jgi:hypothetical protein